MKNNNYQNWSKTDLVEEIKRLKFCIQFFPTPNNLTKEEFLSNSIENILKRGNFYCDRLTYKQQLVNKQNLTFGF